MEKQVLPRVYPGARWSPDIVHLETGRRLKVLGQTGKKPESLQQHRFSYRSILPLSRNGRLNNGRSKKRKSRLPSPPTNFNEYTFRRSRRIYNRVVHEYPVKVIYEKKEDDDPMLRLQNYSSFQIEERDPRFKPLFFACLGLQNKSSTDPLQSDGSADMCDHFESSAVCCISIRNCKTGGFESSEESHRRQCKYCRLHCDEIEFEELLTEGYMIYPHDLLTSPANNYACRFPLKAL